MNFNKKLLIELRLGDSDPFMHTITTDIGKEFTNHQQINEQLVFIFTLQPFTMLGTRCQ